MGGGASVSRPDIVTFRFDTDDGIITINAAKIEQNMDEADLKFFSLTDKDTMIDGIVDIPTLKNKHYNLYWEKITRTLYPLRARIVQKRQKLVAVKRMEICNTSNETGEYTWIVDKSEIKQESLKRKWFAETTTKLVLQIGYKISASSSFEFSSTTSKSEEVEHSKSSKLSSQTNVKVTLNPKQAVLLQLQAVFHSIDIEIEYEASLSGYVMCKSRIVHPHSGYALLYQDIKTTLEKQGKPDILIYKEILTVEYYTDSDKITMTSINRK